MSIMKNPIPILEFDTDQTAVIMPDHEERHIQLPRKAVYAFLGQYVDDYAQKHHARQAAEFVSATKGYPIYVTEYQGEEVCLCQAPVGSAPSAQLLDWLIGHGVREIISTGSCGVLVPMAENLFLIPSKALRDEGASYHYAPPSRFIKVNDAARKAIREAMEAHGLNYEEVTTWSTDGFFRETKEKVAYRKEEGCTVVEMECSALAACAQLRGAVWGEILFTADSLADIETYDERGFGGDSYEYALMLSFEAALRI